MKKDLMILLQSTVTSTLDEVAIFVMGGFCYGFNVENGHEIASSPNCGRRYSIQIIVNLEKSLVKKLHKCDEKKYLEGEDYSRRLALENRAIEILRKLL